MDQDSQRSSSPDDSPTSRAPPSGQGTGPSVEKLALKTASSTAKPIGSTQATASGGTMPSQLQLQQDRSRSASARAKEIINVPFDRFDNQSEIVQPFEEDAASDETHAWASARPRFERHAEAQILEAGINNIADIESKQGPSSGWAGALYEETRQKLVRFVQAVTAAITALRTAV
ncbi:hypothetical protein BKA70DRAFT_1393761 [Coprinopsis sp. MPI-PUGE-AT-0042]|nr:hypothetical protein BKA70DRAFT_1393761 [Coprinopsis sp. MPI-PUGE-AT-0042]